MKAMIFAAGLGTRLRPLTNDLPKALVPYKGKPLLQIVIEKLSKQGVTDFVINVHYFAEKIIRFLNKNENFGQNIEISHEKDSLLETGGGLFYAKKYFSYEDFIIHNVDILSDIDIAKFYDYHKNNNSIVTLAVQKRDSSKMLYFNEQDKCLCKWKNEKTLEEKISRQCNNALPFAFSGIHVVNTKIFDFMNSGAYSIIETYLKAAKTEKITFFDHSNTFWRDMGRPENFID